MTSRSLEKLGGSQPTNFVDGEPRGPFPSNISRAIICKTLSELLDVLENIFYGKVFIEEDFVAAIRVVMGWDEESAVKVWNLVTGKKDGYLVEVGEGEYRYRVESDSESGPYLDLGVEKEKSSVKLADWEIDVLDKSEQLLMREGEMGMLLFEDYIHRRYGVEEPLGKIIEILEKDPEKRFIVGKMTVRLKKWRRKNDV